VRIEEGKSAFHDVNVDLCVYCDGYDISWGRSRCRFVSVDAYKSGHDSTLRAPR
jgi:hypothetical protein